MPEIQNLHLMTALLERNWYVIAVATLMCLIQLAKTRLPQYWSKIPVGWRFLPSVLVAMAGAFVHAFALGQPVTDALSAALNAIWQIAIPAMGGAAALKESHLPWDGGAGGVPAPILQDDRPTPLDPGVVPVPPSDPPSAA